MSATATEQRVYSLPIHHVIEGAEPSDDIYITEQALMALRQLRELNHLPDHYVVRLGIRTGPPQRRIPYTLGFDAQVRPEDYAFPVEDLRFVADARSIFYLMGITLDYTEGPSGRGFLFREPQQPQSQASDTTPDGELRARIIEALKTCYDPEIPVNIWDLGLVYEIKIDPEQNVRIVMTVTTPACPVADLLPRQVEDAVRQVPGVKDVRVEITFDPPWHMGMMSEAARLQLGLM
ncbi:MAG: iron-sulfur cluster assembly protein [Chlorobiota bacterium]